MNIKPWNEMSTLEKGQFIHWDLYKEAYGVRPRDVDTSAWTINDFQVEFEKLHLVIKQKG
jgi:hypothetical protein